LYELITSDDFLFACLYELVTSYDSLFAWLYELVSSYVFLFAWLYEHAVPHIGIMKEKIPRKRLKGNTARHIAASQSKERATVSAARLGQPGACAPKTKYEESRRGSGVNGGIPAGGDYRQKIF
jgi:hypothetical protein